MELELEKNETVGGGGGWLTKEQAGRKLPNQIDIEFDIQKYSGGKSSGWLIIGPNTSRQPPRDYVFHETAKL